MKREKLKGMSIEEIYNFGYKHVSDKINTEEHVRKMEQEKEKLKTSSSRMIKNDFLTIGTSER